MDLEQAPFVGSSPDLSIPRYLLSHGANIAAVNSDGDLPLDLAESDAVEGLLKAEIARRGGLVGVRRELVGAPPRFPACCRTTQGSSQ